jgi:hypothetical protein
MRSRTSERLTYQKFAGRDGREGEGKEEIGLKEMAGSNGWEGRLRKEGEGRRQA